MNRTRRHGGAVLFVLALCVLLCVPGVSLAQGPESRGSGLILASPTRYASTMPPGLVVGAKQPPAVDLSASGLPPVGDQGTQDSCVAWATTYYYKSFQEGLERGWDVAAAEHQFSPAMTYNMRTAFTPDDCTVDGGMRFPDALDILIHQGALPLSDFAYLDTDPCSQPTAVQLSDAYAYRSLGYGAFFVYGQDGQVTEDQIEVLKAYPAGGDVFVIGVPAYSPSFWHPEDNDDRVDVPGVGEELVRYHAVTVVGYDDAIGGFKFVNSWGPAYAGDGFAYLTYDFVKGYAREAWWMVDHVEPKGCIEGTILDDSGLPVPDVTVTVDGPTPWLGTTDQSGQFASGMVLEPGTYTVTPSLAGYVFAPATAEVLVLAEACAVQDFVASAAATQAVVYVEPVSQTIGCGQIATVTVAIRDVTDLYGAQFALTFDPSVIEVIDPDGDPANGVIVPGSIFPENEYQVGHESIDHVTGRIEYALVLLRVPKAPPFSGAGTLAEIAVRGLTDGVSPLVFVYATISDHEARPIEVGTEDGTLTVDCPTAIVGQALLESRLDHSGILVTLQGTGITTLTDASGAYAFDDVAAGTYTVTLEHERFLGVEVTDVVVVENEVTGLASYTLLAGDLNDDGAVDILDLALCAASFGTTAAAADVNADGQVDIYDLVLIGKNFKLDSPQSSVYTP